MCGIFGFINLRRKRLNPMKLFEDFMNLKHRGPDYTSFDIFHDQVVIGFHRLAIIDPMFQSNQPFLLEDGNRSILFVCNGEIYNYKELIAKYNIPQSVKNDCVVIPYLYKKLYADHANGVELFQQFIKTEVRGEFAFMMFEFDRLKNLKKVIVARDEIGIRPLYYHPYSQDDNEPFLLFSSELKGLLTIPTTHVIEFPPGHIQTYEVSELGQIQFQDYDFSSVYDTLPRVMKNTDYKTEIQKSVIQSIRRRLEADKPFAFLLSGGVDSSLVAAISARILGKPIRTFCCGMQEGTDLEFARKVAKHIGSNHTEVFFTAEEGLAAIPDVIRTVESWDTTTIRASVGQYLVSKYISTNTDCKVVMVGEGPDEVCSSYLFNWYAPSGEAMHQTAIEYVKKIHCYDVKRADRCISRWSLEGRVPLLDPEFIKAYWSIPAAERMPTYENMEKWWLRDAFNETKILPNSVLWRKKEAFSDGVSGEKSWYQIIQEWVEDKVTVEEMEQAAVKYPYCTPKTKEAFYYRKVFCEIFGESRQQVIPGYWQPKWTVEKKEVTEYVDPSARVLEVY